MARKISRVIHVLSVESYSAVDDDWDDLGSVLLPDFAPGWQVEHALAVLGLYVPRGADYIDWCEDLGNTPRAIVYDGNDRPMVRLGFAMREKAGQRATAREQPA
jgi:hypothetical protein